MIRTSEGSYFFEGRFSNADNIRAHNPTKKKKTISAFFFKKKFSSKPDLTIFISIGPQLFKVPNESF